MSSGPGYHRDRPKCTVTLTQENKDRTVVRLEPLSFGAIYPWSPVSALTLIPPPYNIYGLKSCVVRGSPGIKSLRKSRHDHFLAAGSQSPPQVVWRVSVGEIDQRGVECGIPNPDNFC